MNLLEIKIHSTLEKLSNDEPVDIQEEWIEDAGENFKKALRKQLLDKEKRQFKIRMSNIGKPLCQLQHEKAGTEKARKPYNHIVRMMLGDASECITEVLLKAAKANITGGKVRVEANYGGVDVQGEDDIHIDEKVYDIKSCSPWAFTNKWAKGWEGVSQYDDFGYVPQLVGYADAQGKKAGGWIVLNKSTGEIAVVEAEPTYHDLIEIRNGMHETARTIHEDRPFERGFSDQEEWFRKEKTGNRVLSKTCEMCDFRSACWPDAKQRPQAMSKAKDPKLVWYTELKDAA